MLTEYSRVPAVGSCVRLLIEADAGGLPNYAARTVTRRRDIRDDLTDLVQALVDAAIDADPAKQNKIVRLLFGGRLDVGAPPETGHLRPQATANERARSAEQPRRLHETNSGSSG